MATYTKEVILSTVLSLLDEKPLEKITVKDIVEHCGVNRNTFYYHFQDIPRAVDEALRQELEQFMAQAHSCFSLMDTLASIIGCINKHQKAMLHLYHSSRSEIFIHYLRILISSALDQFFRNQEKTESSLSPTLDALYYCCHCLFQGFLIDWMDCGMNYDILARFAFLSQLPALSEILTGYGSLAGTEELVSSLPLPDPKNLFDHISLDK